MSDNKKESLTEVKPELNQSLTDDGKPEGEESTQTPEESPTIDFLSNPDVKAYIDKMVAEGVKTALKGKAPKANTADPTDAEKTAFKKMGYKERLKLFNADPATYQKLSKGSK